MVIHKFRAVAPRPSSAARLIPPLALTLIGCALLSPATALAADTKSASTAPPCTSERQLAAADAYIAALGDRTKANAVPFAPNAVRFENGLQTGFSGAQMRRDLDLHIQYSVMTTPIVHTRTVGVNGNANVLRYTFTVPVVIAGQHIMNAPTDETFRIPTSTCLIERIDATISVAPV